MILKLRQINTSHPNSDFTAQAWLPNIHHTHAWGTSCSCLAPHRLSHNITSSTAMPVEMSYSLVIPENILHTALLWRRTEHTSISQPGSRCWLAARSSAMEALLPPPSPGPYPTSKESTNTIRVWAGGGRSSRGPSTALRACKNKTDTQREEIKFKTAV